MRLDLVLPAESPGMPFDEVLELAVVAELAAAVGLWLRTACARLPDS